MFLIKKLKPDYFTEAVSNYVAATIGREFVTPSVFDLNDLYAESDCRTPVMFILAPGKIYKFRSNIEIKHPTQGDQTRVTKDLKGSF